MEKGPLKMIDVPMIDVPMMYLKEKNQSWRPESSIQKYTIIVYYNCFFTSITGHRNEKV